MEKLQDNHVGYNGEKIYITATAKIERILKSEQTFIDRDYTDRTPLAQMRAVPGEVDFRDFAHVKTDRGLIADAPSGVNSKKFASADLTGLAGVAIVDSSGNRTATKAQGYKPILIWTSKSILKAYHSMGMRTIAYLDPQRKNSPALQFDFFVGATRLYEESVFLLLIK